MTTPNVKEELKKLSELQEFDKKIFDLKKEKTGIPLALDEIQKEFEIKRAKLKSLEENKQKLQLKQKEREVELGAKEESIKKSQSQLGLLKTNKDYQLKLSEIGNFKADNSVIEEEILKLMDEIDNSKTAIEAEKKSLEGEEKIYSEKKNTVSSRTKEIDALLDTLENKRRIISTTIDKKILAQYEYILPAKSGLALAEVLGNSCKGCFMHVPAQVINEIKMHERLVICENCSRILFLQEDL